MNRGFRQAARLSKKTKTKNFVKKCDISVSGFADSVLPSGRDSMHGLIVYRYRRDFGALELKANRSPK
jgi:hypothetical protein